MSLLDNLGYPRAVVLTIEDVGLGHTRVTFCNNDPQFETRPTSMKARSAWPDWQETVKPDSPLFPTQVNKADDVVNSVETEFVYKDVLELIAAGTEFLNSNFEELDLPDFIQEAVCQPKTKANYDRWLIYTDGSSQSNLRRMAPPTGR